LIRTFFLYYLEFESLGWDGDLPWNDLEQMVQNIVTWDDFSNAKNSTNALQIISLGIRPF
jgi:hypothetical protein